MLDLTKPVQTRYGHEVRIYATDGRAPYEIHGAVKQNGGWVEYMWYADGHYLQFQDNQYDLVNVPPPKRKLTFYVNIYDGDTLGSKLLFHTTRESAERSYREWGGSGRIACIPVTVEYEEGEGLSCH